MGSTTPPYGIQPVPVTSGSMAVSPGTAPGDHAACDTWIARLKARAEAAEGKMAAFGEHREAVLNALVVAARTTDQEWEAERYRAALEALESGEEKNRG